MSEWNEEARRWEHEESPPPSIPMVHYREDLSERWRCTVHNRPATHVRTSSARSAPERCCDPALGGIMIPCRCEKES